MPRFPGLAAQLLEDAGAVAGQRVEPGRVVELLADRPLEAAVAGQPEDLERSIMALAEGHQGIAAEPRVAADDDSVARPARADTPVGELHELDDTRRAVLVGGPEDRGEQVVSAEGVERQEAALIVEAVEKRPSCLPWTGSSVASKSMTISSGAVGYESRKASTKNSLIFPSSHSMRL